METCKGWYAVLSSKELRQAPLAFRRFGKDLVAWRESSGKPVIMEDLCPHRSVKLSLGTVKDDRISCPFHGFEFGSDGSCRLVPETKKEAPNLRCPALPSRENHDLIWLWHGEIEEIEGEPPWFDELDAEFASSELQSLWPCHITRCIENQLDYAHLPYVHATTIGRGFDVTGRDGNFILADQSIKMSMEKGFFHFKFPNIWLLQIVPGKFYQFVAFSPVDEKHTLIYARAYQKFVTFPGVRDLLGMIMSFQSNIILNQDKRVVSSQPLAPSPLFSDEKFYPSDRGIAHFRKRWSDSSFSQ